MIVVILNNATPDNFDGVIDTIDISVINPPIDPRVCAAINDVCYEELAFYKSGGETWENDSATVLVELFLLGDSNTFKLFKKGIKEAVATITNNNFGVFIPIGGYPTQLFKTSFKADWLLIQAAFGNGLYHIESDQTILNINDQKITHNYRVIEFTEVLARDTIVIKTIQNGIIEGGINYIGMEFEQQIRIVGHISGAERTLETDRYLSQKLTLEQIQEKVIKNYTIKTRLLPTNIASPLLDDKIMANSIKITNYGFFEFDCHLDLEVVLEEFTESLYFSKTKDGVFELNFTARIQDLRKRNFI